MIKSPPLSAHNEKDRKTQAAKAAKFQLGCFKSPEHVQRLCTRNVQHQSPVMGAHIELLLRKKGMTLSTLRGWMAEKCVDTATLETNPPNLSGKTKGLHWIRGNSSSILEGAQSQPLIA